VTCLSGVAGVIRSVLSGFACLSGLVAVAGLAGCKPDLDQTISVVSAPVVIAVRSDPPEVPESTSVHLTALYVDGNGPITGPINWAFCTARNPLANLGSVNPECLDLSGAWLDPIGTGVTVSGTVPDIACQQFGPYVPQPQPGQPQGRPVDPDPTGGYYQPTRLIVPSDGGALPGIAETRLACSTSNGASYNRRYHANVNPVVASLTVVQGASTSSPWSMDGVADAGLASDGGLANEGGAADGGAPPDGPNIVQAGSHMTLRAAWPPCPLTDRCGDGICGADEYMLECPSDCTNPVGCAGAERFVDFDVTSQTVYDVRESMTVSWFTSGGSFDSDSTGRDSTDLTTSSDNGWTAPATAGTVHLWVVLRDDRGGTGWGEYTILVQ
jgi:hypothetical protein